ncbi:MAG: hypothetical protein Q7U57_09275 [Methylovulum sp.]|nr:hypothetical protein [Methylovulum sp.]
MSNVLLTVKEDIKTSIPTVLFFLAAFHLLAFTRKLVEDSYGITLGDSSAATIGALIVAKAILIVNKLRVANCMADLPLVFGIFWKALIYSMFAWLFRLLEELIPLVVKYDGVSVAVSHLLTGVVWPRFWALNLVLFMLLIIYCVGVELIRVLGAEKVTAIFLGFPARSN